MNKLTQRLTEERERRGSLRAAAKALGVAPGTYEGWERGWREPPMKQRKKIAAFFDEPEFVILGWLGYLDDEQVALLADAMRKYLSSARAPVAA